MDRSEFQELKRWWAGVGAGLGFGICTLCLLNFPSTVPLPLLD